MIDHIAYTPHLLWGYGFIPQLTDVHDEYMSLTGRYESGGMTKAEILASLTAKRDAIYGFVTMASEEAGTAFSEAAAVLETCDEPRRSTSETGRGAVRRPAPSSACGGVKGRSPPNAPSAAGPSRAIDCGRQEVAMEKLVVTAGLTGSRISKEQTPHIPITPDEIVASGLEAWRAGASVLHVHVRDPETGLGTQDLAVFTPVVDRLRAETDAVLCLTTSGIPGRNLPVEERIAPLELRPELASFDAGSINTPAGVFLNPPEFLDALAAKALELGVKPELECFDAGHVATCLRYLDEGKLRAPLHFQFVLGAPYGMPATAASLVHLDRDDPGRRDVVGDRHRARADAHGRAGDRHGRPRARRARGQHLLRQGRAGDEQRAARRAGRQAGRASSAARSRRRPRRGGSSG